MPTSLNIRNNPLHGRTEPLVHIVDGQPAVRDALKILVESEGLPARCFATEKDFLDYCTPDTHGCILLDLRLPEISGLELQKTLTDKGIRTPIIFISGKGDVPAVAEAFRSGAFDFIEKPFENAGFMNRLREAIALDLRTCEHRRRQAEAASQYARLSKREKQVLHCTVKGYSSKDTAKSLGISHRTVEIYRANVMRKMRAETLAELVRIALLLETD
ncbi:response regulator [Methylococcus sp. ANG]|uniref:response regulator transcription factor n=1 Tax=unclassified Methylococcus TaxID=2618889 RepID=UPI001C532342|nr:response regulator [Methylococcus sp. Mc7]QXP85637.1 response regulator [Methylococcus sp. Mc7]